MPAELVIELPVEDPLARGYQYYGYPLAILASDPRTTDWVLSNYMQTAIDRRGWDTDVPFSFYMYDATASPWLDVVRGTRHWYGSADICEVIRQGLALGYYVYTFVDEFHVPRRRKYQVDRAPHDILVHGVDDRSGSFTVLGYDERMQFCSTQLSQGDFQKAYASLDDVGMENAPVIFMRLRANDEPDFGYEPIEYGLNLDLIRQSLDEYLRSFNTSLHYQALRKPLQFMTTGMETYEHLDAFIRLYAAREVRYDVRHLHILWEHKRLMVERIGRLSQLLGPMESIESEARRIERAAGDLRNAMMRDRMQNGRPGYLDSSLSMLHDIRQTEERILPQLIAVIDGTER